MATRDGSGAMCSADDAKLFQGANAPIHGRLSEAEKRMGMLYEEWFCRLKEGCDPVAEKIFPKALTLSDAFVAEDLHVVSGKDGGKELSLLLPAEVVIDLALFHIAIFDVRADVLMRSSRADVRLVGI